LTDGENSEIKRRMVRCEKVTKVYNTGKTPVTALRDVDLDVKKGEFLSIMGPSGSGKSTLLHLMGCLDVPTSGEIILEGQRTSGLTDRELTLLRRKKIGFVFQFFNLLPTLTAEENVALPLLLDGKRPKEVRVRARELLEHVGLAGRAHHTPDEMSGGEMQRVAIARALVTNPSLILADEPTGNLDTKTGEGILKLLRKVRDDYGHTIILVTHDLRAAAFGERTIVLRDGQIVNDSVPHAKKRRRAYRRDH